jgi:5-formyltetrahydrofolate cyclo-ligase
MNGIADQKRRLRGTVRAARSSLDADAGADAAWAVAARLLRLPAVTGARGVLAYAATVEELDPAPAVAALRESGARIAYPRVCGPGEIELRWATVDELAGGYRGILEPTAESDRADVDDFDLVLVPGVAFDTACHRLGMGGGFYDRLLGRLGSRALAVGLAFDVQIVDAVPREAHDAAVDAVVTPTRTIWREM